MVRKSGIAWIMASVAALLAGCASGPNTGADLQQKAASPTASCSGYLRAFGDVQSQATSLTCNGAERPYVAYADSIAHRFSPCAYSFEAAGGGQMNCSNGTSGPLTYDMTDAANIKVVASLNDGRQMAFTLRDE